MEESASKQTRISHILFSVLPNKWPPFSVLCMLNRTGKQEETHEPFDKQKQNIAQRRL